MSGPVYGFCPICGAPGLSRERRPNGNDRCYLSHVYPSSQARSGFDDSTEATIARLQEAALSGVIVRCFATDLHRVLELVAKKGGV